MKKLVILTILFFLFPFKVLANEKIEVKLEKCVDGDTAKFVINKEIYTFRFLAIDTPESTNKIQEYGKEASLYTCNLLTNANIIQIEYDNNSDKKDKYGRILAWVFIDNKLLQNEIIKNGYAKTAYLYDNYKYTNQLLESEKYAQENKLNIWNDYEEENNTLFYILIIISIVILCLVSTKYRKKIISKIKRKTKKELKKSFKI